MENNILCLFLQTHNKTEASLACDSECAASYYKINWYKIHISKHIRCNGTLQMCSCFVSTADQNIRLYDTTQRRFNLLRTVKARDVGWSVLDVCFTPDTRHILYSSWSDYSKTRAPFTHAIYPLNLPENFLNGLKCECEWNPGKSVGAISHLKTFPEHCRKRANLSQDCVLLYRHLLDCALTIYCGIAMSVWKSTRLKCSGT